MADEVCDNLTVNKNATMLGNVDITGFNFNPGNYNFTRVSIPFSQPTGNLCVFNQVGIGSVGPVIPQIAAATGSLVVNGGNVGFGTLYPEAGLHIEKRATNDVALMLSSTGPGWGSGIQFKNNDILYGIFAGSECFHICDAKKQVDRLSIDANGNVGIGTTTPQRKLDVNGDSNIFGNLTVAKNLGIGTPTPRHTLDVIGDINTNGNLTVGSNLGIGTSTPQHQLEVIGDSNIFGNLTVAKNIGIGTPTPQYTLDVIGTINATVDVVVGGADCAEDFDIVDAESIEPGTVMVIDNDGALRASEQAYDKRVAGVISGAGNLRPGITLGKQNNKANRLPVALNGKVYCKVDAEYNQIEVGDLLTSSSTAGHAMKANDPFKAFGAVIGKALKPLKADQDLIPILVALQ